MENDLKGNENYYELTGGSSCRGFELPGVDCICIFRIVKSQTCPKQLSGVLVQRKQLHGRSLRNKCILNVKGARPLLGKEQLK